MKTGSTGQVQYGRSTDAVCGNRDQHSCRSIITTAIATVASCIFAAALPCGTLQASLLLFVGAQALKSMTTNKHVQTVADVVVTVAVSSSIVSLGTMAADVIAPYIGHQVYLYALKNGLTIVQRISVVRHHPYVYVLKEGLIRLSQCVAACYLCCRARAYIPARTPRTAHELSPI